MIDDLGIYYDSAVPSALEALLNSAADVFNGLEEDVLRAKSVLLAQRLGASTTRRPC